ncbi:hypothetical protein D3C86_1769790 [compost metagenome]
MQAVLQLVHLLLQRLHLLIGEQLQHDPADFEGQLVADILHILRGRQRVELQQLIKNLLQHQQAFLSVA